jgi:hypothetical protein
MAECLIHNTHVTGPKATGPEPEPPRRRPIQPIVPDPEISPQKSPDVSPERITRPEIAPGVPGTPEIFPQRSPDATPPDEMPSEPDRQPPGEIPPLHD